MEQATHTPGPWRLAPATAYSDSELNIDAGPSGTLDYICCAGHRGDLNAEANAKLIASAPDLLDALRNFTDGRDISYVDALEIARRTIASAA